MAKSQVSKDTAKLTTSTTDYAREIKDAYCRGYEKGKEHGKEEMYKKISKSLKDYKKRQRCINEIMIRGGIR